jgi:hypothetical protein
VVLPPQPPPIPEDQKSDYMKMLDNISRATKEEREKKNNPPPPPKVPEAVKRHAEAMRQQQADEVPVYQPKLPSKQEKLLKDLEDPQRIRKPGEPPPSPPKVYPISGGAALNLEIPTEDPPKSKYEELQRELASLESQYQRMNTLKERKWNHLGQKLLSYEEGFTWCPKCHYVSNISLQSELRHRCGLRGCQRRSCEECYQWDRVGPYEEDDFLYEGPKTKQICEAYWKGTVGCTEGNKCLDHHQFWPATKENEGRCFVCGMKGGQEGSHRSTYCERPGGRYENVDIAIKVDSFLIPKLPKRPNGESPRRVKVNEVGRRSRSRSKSRSHHRHQQEDTLPHGISPWEYGERVEEQRIHATKALSTARKELARSGQVSKEIESILQDIMQRHPDLEVNGEIEEFLQTAPILQQMSVIRKTIEENHKTEEYERYQRGELIKPEVLEGTPSQGTPERGMTSYEGDSGGAGSSNDGRPRVKTLKVIKIEVEDDEEKGRSLGSILPAIVTVLMTVAMQWLFGRCQRRNQPLTEQQPTIEDESEEEFELVDEAEEFQTGTTGETEEQGEEVEEQDSQQEGPQHTQQEAPREQPTTPPEGQEVPEGRRIYVTKYGEKYHLNSRCTSILNYQKFEKIPCYQCRERAEDQVSINRNGTMSTSESEVGFVKGTEVYHHIECDRYLYGRVRSKRSMCKICEDEERLLVWARNR